jgi:hypothetical protein
MAGYATYKKGGATPAVTGQSDYAFFAEDAAIMPQYASDLITIVNISNANEDNTGATGSLSPAIPTDSQADDLMVAYMFHDLQNGGTKGTATEDATTGWIFLEDIEDTDGRDREMTIAYKKHSGSESTPTFSHNASATHAYSATIVSYRSIDTSALFDVTYDEPTHHTDVANDPTPDPSAIETVTPGAMVIVFASVTHDDISNWVMPANYTERYSFDGNDAGTDVYRQNAICDDIIDVAGVENPVAFDNVNDNPTRGEGSTITLALRPAVVEAGRSLIGAVNAEQTLNTDTSYGLSLRLENSGGDDDIVSYTVQFKYGADNYVTLGTGTSKVKLMATTDYAQGDDVPPYLQTKVPGAGAYMATTNNAALDTSAVFAPSIIPAGGALETHLTFQIIDADVDHDVIVKWRVVETVGLADLDSYVDGSCKINKPVVHALEIARSVVIHP